MSEPPFGDPIDPNPQVTPAAPDYSDWYPSASAANVVSYPNYYAPPAPPYAPPYAGHPAYPSYPVYPSYPGYPSYSGYPGYPGYSGYPPSGSRRPGEVVTAAVLSLISAGLLLITGFVIIFAANVADGSDESFESHSEAQDFVLAGLLNVVTAALLIIGAVMLLGRSRSGRPVLAVATLLCLALGVFWLVQDQSNGDSGIGIWLVIFCAPVVTAAVLMSTGRVSSWLNGTAPG